MSLGKKKYIVDNSVVSIGSGLIEALLQAAGVGTVTDRFREITGKYWIFDGDTLNYGGSDNSLNYSISSATYDSETMTYTEVISFNVDEIRAWLGTSTSNSLTANDAESAATIALQEMGVLPESEGDTSAMTTMDFGDHYNQYFTPFDSAEQRNLTQNSLITNGDVDFVYNFYNSVTEKALNEMPNAEFIKTRTIFDTYEGIEKRNTKFIGGVSILSPQVLNSLQDISLNKRNEPMYTDLSFDTDSISSLAEKIETVDYTTAMIIKSLSYARGNGVTGSFMLAQSLVDNEGVAGVDAEATTIAYIDYKQFINDLDLSSIHLNNSVQVYDLNHSEKGYNNSTAMDVSAFFAKAVVAGMLQNTIQDNMRTYEDILNGNVCHSETLYYDISKFENGTLLERTFVPNTVDTSINNIIDTHVRYDRQYRYQVNAYKLVIGSKYSYVGADATQSGTSTSAESFGTPTWSSIQVTVETTPSVVLMRVPYFSYDGTMIDSPSIAPDIQPIPYMGVDNRILFLLNQPIGTYEKQPISLNPEETRVIQQYRRRANQSPNSPVSYNTDDAPRHFFVYRMSTMPRAYTDFNDNLRKQVSSKLDNEENTFGFDVSFVDEVQPNRKYYYLFRSVDVHGNPSDVSDIYELQIINDNGAIYLLTNIVEIDTESRYTQPSIPFRRLLRAKPSLQQASFDGDMLNAYSSVIAINSVNALGVASDSVWTNAFKFRITSKKTGRKIDLNVDFNQTYQKRPAVEESKMHIPDDAEPFN